jgi:type II secretory pathway predicted ATPase ExeA
MIEKHFGFRRRPFRATPDSDSYYPATTHEVALARLTQGIAEDEGLFLVTGAPGTGKTLLCHRLLEQLGAETTSAFLTNGHISGCIGLLQAILFDFSLPYEGRSEQELRLALTDHLLQTFSAGRRSVLVVDEAHHLTADVLEELRLLSNLEARQGKALHVVLAAQPAIRETLGQPQLAGFQQRLIVRPQLETLGVHEAADYLVHQLRTAGGRPERIMTDEALEILARGTQGVPRLLNQAGHQALGLAASAGADQVDAEVALEALAALGLEAVEPGEDDASLPAATIRPAAEGLDLLVDDAEQAQTDRIEPTRSLSARLAPDPEVHERPMVSSRRPA